MTERVVKIGGRALGEPGWLQAFAVEAASLGPGLVVVHGGGPEITALSSRLGLVTVWEGGRRVTTPEALGVAAMVLSGSINKRVVSALQGAGLDALGLSGEDAGLVRAKVAEEGRLGRVGEVVSVRGSLLRELLRLGLVPVLSPICRGPDGEPLNVNADDVAVAVARALGASELVFVTDVPVSDATGPRRSLSVREAEELRATGVARDGMAVKLEAAVSALGAGIGRVRIGPLGALRDPGAGTVVSIDVEEAA